jgi:hypothetical protein
LAHNHAWPEIWEHAKTRGPEQPPRFSTVGSRELNRLTGVTFRVTFHTGPLPPTLQVLGLPPPRARPCPPNTSGEHSYRRGACPLRPHHDVPRVRRKVSALFCRCFVSPGCRSRTSMIEPTARKGLAWPLMLMTIEPTGGHPRRHLSLLSSHDYPWWNSWMSPSFLAFSSRLTCA